MYQVADLADFIRQKAGIAEMGPVAQYFAKRDAPEATKLCLFDGEGV